MPGKGVLVLEERGELVRRDGGQPFVVRPA
jgi:hypothetical protein